MGTSTRPSPRRRMSCARICGCIAAPAIRWRAAASSPKSPIAKPRSGRRPRRRTICAPPIADYIDLDESRLRVATPDVGGGFGPKLCVYPEDVAVVAAATLLGRSVKWIEDRREHFTNAAQERDQYWSIEIAADAEGRVRGVRGRLLHDIGAYALQDVNIPYNSATTLTGPYVVPALAMDVVATHTNKAPVSSVRGAGYPQAAFAMERLMDRLARALKIDRAELRRRNLIPAEKMPYPKPLKARSGEQVQYDSGDYPGCQAEILRAAGWDDFPRRQAEARAQGRYIGIGLAHGIKGTGRGPFEFGNVRVSPTGRITVSPAPRRWARGLHRAGADLRRGVRRARAGCQRRRRRHCGGAARARRLRQPPDRHGRLIGADRGAGGRGQGAQARQPHAGSGRGGSRNRRRRSARGRRAAACRQARRARAHAQRRARLRLSAGHRAGA